MTYTGSGDPGPQLADYYPAWLDNLADDVTLEGSRSCHHGCWLEAA